MGCLGRKWGAFGCLATNRCVWVYNGVFETQMRCFGHGVKGVFGG